MARLLHPVVDAAEELGIARSKLYSLIKDGDIAAVKIGRRTLVAHEELERYASSLSRRHQVDFGKDDAFL